MPISTTTDTRFLRGKSFEPTPIRRRHQPECERGGLKTINFWPAEQSSGSCVLEQAPGKLGPQTFGRCGLLVSESDDGVVAGGAQCGVDCSCGSSHKCQRGRGKNPRRGNQNLQPWIDLLQNPLRHKSQPDPQTLSHPP